MKTITRARALTLLLCLALCLSLLSSSVFAAGAIWTEAPTGWKNWGHVHYETKTVGGKTYVLNWGVRGETATFLTKYAKNYYPDDDNGQGVDWCYDLINSKAGGTGTADAVSSPLYAYLHSFLEAKQNHLTTYAETRDLYQYTDCMASNSSYISSFYSGQKLKGAWDGGSTWNREHTWPKSKSTGNQENDIMMLRPTSVQENSTRGNMAYGESAGFYNPNSEAGNTGLDLRGDCARICLYCYVRWSENAGSMWGQSGVMESLDVLLSWMEQDPVDTWEMGRNDAAQSITGVRNCFVDYPELAWALFGREIPEYYTTPCKADHNYFVSDPAYLLARSDNETHGTVQVSGWAVDCTPASGYFASGYDVYDVSGEVLLGDTEPSLFRWEYGRLLFFPRNEEDYLVEIHFTPVGQEDPCPTGHSFDSDSAVITQAPTCLEQGRGLVTCSRCGVQREISLKELGHDWGEGVVVREATIDEPGEIEFTCSRCHSTFSDVVWFRFDDVNDERKYYFAPVYWAVDHDPRITAGTDGTHFSPKATCTREQVVTFLYAACSKPEHHQTGSPFTDIQAGKYYYNPVMWALENNITRGISDTSFGVGQPCTREQVVTFLWKAAGAPEPTAADCPFTDVEGKYYRKAVLWALENGVTGGMTDTSFGVGQPCTRGQIVTFLFAAYQAGAIG